MMTDTDRSASFPMPVKMPSSALSAPAKEYSILPVAGSFIATQPSRQHVMWIGCSDSLVSETDCLDINRDEIFVVRNLGGRVSNGDLSSVSALEWAVNLLKVDHIVICGHNDCEVIKQELAGEEVRGWETYEF
jgi:carbonic anhydrase